MYKLALGDFSIHAYSHRSNTNKVEAKAFDDQVLKGPSSSSLDLWFKSCSHFFALTMAFRQILSRPYLCLSRLVAFVMNGCCLTECLSQFKLDV
jgi:hypothetical protein